MKLALKVLMQYYKFANFANYKNNRSKQGNPV